MRIRKPLTIAATLLGATLLAGCSSKNPDALTAANVDENLAMTNSESNAAGNVQAADRNAAGSVNAGQAPSVRDSGSDSDVDNAANLLKSTDADDKVIDQEEAHFNEPEDEDGN